VYSPTNDITNGKSSGWRLRVREPAASRNDSRVSITTGHPFCLKPDESPSDCRKCIRRLSSRWPCYFR